MGIFDRFKDQAKAKGKDVSDAAEQQVNEKTGGKYTEQVDKGQQMMEEKLGIDDDPMK
ncbi:Rv0909 family putative TA system antitoxin [Streptomyces sp. NPDC091371]|uniref:Rv0909 family putative TA system antitoxin n=1 Tax=Streptomyces sp. NPDC091371 TaxID=3155303 RepID=UPI00343B0DFA